jgi:DNA-directed RNA polymerase alpha subunit
MSTKTVCDSCGITLVLGKSLDVAVNVKQRGNSGMVCYDACSYKCARKILTTFIKGLPTDEEVNRVKTSGEYGIKDSPLKTAMLNTSVDELDLSVRVANALQNHCIHYIHQLNCLTVGNSAALKGMGFTAKMIKNVTEEIAKWRASQP